MDRARILIIGGGVAGLSTAWQLACHGRGVGTVLLEREPQLASHSTALNAGILRTLGADPLSARIARRSANFLRQPPPGFSDVPLVDRRGLVLAADEQRAAGLRAWVDAARAEAKVDALTPVALRAMVPAFEGELASAFHFPEEGQIDIAALVAGFVRGAREGGVDLRRHCEVSDLLCEGQRVDGVRLRSGQALHADVTVIAAGAWAGALGRAAGSRAVLRPTRRHLLVTAPDSSFDRRAPVFWRLGQEEFYCRPESGGMLLCACEVSDVDPNRCVPDASARDRIARRAARFMPVLADAGAAHFWCGMRTLTRDDRFAIGPDPDVEGLFWVAGLGGAGMVCSAEVGRIAAAGLLDLEIESEVANALAPSRLCEDAGR